MKNYLAIVDGWCLVAPNQSEVPLVKLMKAAQVHYGLGFRFKLNDDGIWAKRVEATEGMSPEMLKEYEAATVHLPPYTKKHLKRDANIVGSYIKGVVHGLEYRKFVEKK